MEVRLLTAIDYGILVSELENRDIKQVNDIVLLLDGLEKEERFKRIPAQDYFTFEVKGVSALVEQMLRSEQSCKVVPHFKAPNELEEFYIPKVFHGEDGKTLKNSDFIRQEYHRYMSSLYSRYFNLVAEGISKEDAKAVLPICFQTNLFVSMDAVTLKNLIIRYTKGPLSKMQEIKEFGNTLYDIASNYAPYLIAEIDEVEKATDVFSFILQQEKEQTPVSLPLPVLVSKTPSVDRTIMMSAIMKKYQLHYVKAHNYIAKMLDQNPNFARDIMQCIIFSKKEDHSELRQVSFQFQLPVSFKGLLHLKTLPSANVLSPSFDTALPLTTSIISPDINEDASKLLLDVMKQHQVMYSIFRKIHEVCEEDLSYFTLQGNACNVTMGVNGETLVELLSCKSDDWEMNKIAKGIYECLKKCPDAAVFSSLIGTACKEKDREKVKSFIPEE